MDEPRRDPSLHRFCRFLYLLLIVSHLGVLVGVLLPLPLPWGYHTEPIPVGLLAEAWWLWWLWWLFFILQPIALMAIPIKRREASGTMYASHLTWANNTFAWTLGWFVSLMLIFPVGVVLCLWNVHRLVRGAIRLARDQPVPS